MAISSLSPVVPSGANVAGGVYVAGYTRNAPNCGSCLAIERRGSTTIATLLISAKSLAQASCYAAGGEI
jgi:hypothetical protein